MSLSTFLGLALLFKELQDNLNVITFFGIASSLKDWKDFQKWEVRELPDDFFETRTSIFIGSHEVFGVRGDGQLESESTDEPSES